MNSVAGIKGVVLAGGLGTRLLPLTKVANKHLLPVFDKPMIYYPIAKLVQAGIREISIVVGGHHAGMFLELLGNGKAFGLNTLHYTYQEGEGGIAQALALTEPFVKGDPVCVILGDNIFEASIQEATERFLSRRRGARIFLKEVPDPERFGVAEIRDGKLIGIEEKPRHPKSNYAVTGIYMYDSRVFEYIRRLKPSGRGELEITDVNNLYLQAGDLEYEILPGWWTDAGTFDSLQRASRLVQAARPGWFPTFLPTTPESSLPPTALTSTSAPA